MLSYPRAALFDTARVLAKAAGGVLGAAALLLLAACAGQPAAQPLRLPALAALTPKTPVVLVPGITGTALYDPATGELAWGNAAHLFTPHDGGYALALPLVEPGDDATDPLQVGRVLEEMHLLGFKKPIYGPIRELLEANGYRTGDLDHPSAEATFYPFAYDWRRDNVATARQLARRLEAVRRERGTETLHVALICQSNGAHICRWLAKYGDATLAEAEAQVGLDGARTAPAEPPAARSEPGQRPRSAAETAAEAPPRPGDASPSSTRDSESLRPGELPKTAPGPRRLAIDKVILVGTSNGGSLRILREMNRGRSYVPLLGRRWQPETLFTFRSLFQDLPVYRDDLFVDQDGRPLAVDLFAAESWWRYGWSIWGEETRRRLERHGGPPGFGDEAARRAYLARQLDRARRLHRLLAADAPGFGDTRYYLVQSAYEETADRALLRRTDRGWETSFTGDPELRRDPYLESVTGSPGDGHATLASQLYLSPQERRALAAEPHLVHGRHFEMILSPATGRSLLEMLADGEEAAASHPSGPGAGDR